MQLFRATMIIDRIAPSAGHWLGPRAIRRSVRASSSLLLALFAGLCCGCGSPSETTQGRPEAPAGPDQSFQDLTLRETSEKGLDWILNAREAVRESRTASTRLTGLKVEFYQGGHEVRSTLTSDSGRVDTRKGFLHAMGNVVVVTPEGNRLETEDLIWDRKNALVSSDVLVRFYHDEDILTGVGFVSDPNLEHYELKKDVHASVRDAAPQRP